MWPLTKRTYSKWPRIRKLPVKPWDLATTSLCMTSTLSLLTITNFHQSKTIKMFKTRTTSTKTPWKRSRMRLMWTKIRFQRRWSSKTTMLRITSHWLKRTIKILKASTSKQWMLVSTRSLNRCPTFNSTTRRIVSTDLEVHNMGKRLILIKTTATKGFTATKEHCKFKIKIWTGSHRTTKDLGNRLI